MPEFTVRSRLRVDADELWRHAVSPSGVNREFRPFLKMTFPIDVSSLDSAWRPGETMFRSWILLFGVIPVEYDDIAFFEVDVGRRFLERSRMATQRLWEHERTIEPLPGGESLLTDRVRFEPRLAWLGALSAPLFRLTFALRHRNLRRDFDGRAA